MSSTGHLAAPMPSADEPLREDVLASVADLVGNTPLVELRVLAAGLPARVLVKLEGRNPGGSAKDRVAFNIIRQAEASGALAPGRDDRRPRTRRSPRLPQQQRPQR
nr:pyridoxal-phosphate dependent enzyme [Cryobacterium sp. TMS1-13-1]